MKRRAFLLSVLIMLFVVLFAACGSSDDKCKTHKYGEWTETKAATCTEDGKQTRKCSKCKKKETQVIRAGHDWSSMDITVQATHTKQGEKKSTCGRCGEKLIETIPVKAEHEWGEWQIVDEPSCTEAGSKKRACVCGINETKPVAQLDHDPVGVITVAPTCEADGHTDGLKCSLCETTLVEPGVMPKLGHNLEQVLNTVKVCTGGVIAYECTNEGCDYSEQAVVPGTGHLSLGAEVEDESARAPVAGQGCTIKYTFKATCADCNTVVSRYETRTQHTLSSVIYSAATCVSDGQLKYSCDNCSHVEYKPYSNADAHNWQLYSTQGDVKMYKCTNGTCGKTKTAIDKSSQENATVNKSALANNNIALKDAELSIDNAILGQLSGTVSLKAEKADKNTLGLTSNQLNQIGNNPVYNFGLSSSSGTPEKFDGWITITVPYQLQPGEDPELIAVWYVDADGEVHGIQATYNNGFATFKTNHFSYYTVTRLTPAERCALYGHNNLVVEKLVTCTVDGYKREICQRCGFIKEVSKTVAQGHKYTNTVLVQVNCDTVGQIKHDCDNCDTEYIETVKATGHSYSDTVVPATCTTNGYTLSKCSTCSKEYKHTYVYGAHDFAKSVTQPTCSTDGKIVEICSRCEFTREEKLDATGKHDMVAGKCTVCEKACSDEYIKSVPATCTSEGYKAKACLTCNYEIVTETIPALGHEGQGTCTRCGTKMGSYANILTSILKNDLSLRITNYKINYNEMGAGMVMDFAELVIGVNDAGVLTGYGSGSIKSVIGLKEYSEISFKCVLNGEMLYIKGDNLASLMGGSVMGAMFTKSDSNMYMAVPISTIFMRNGGSSSSPDFDYDNGINTGGFDSEQAPLENVLNIDFGAALGKIYSGIKPFANGIINGNDTNISNLVKGFLKAVCTETKSGTDTVYTLDKAKVEQVVMMLREKTVAQVIDHYYGVGSFARFETELLAIFDMSAANLVTAWKNQGFDIKDFVLFLDEVIDLMTDGEYETFSDYVYDMTEGEYNLAQILDDKLLFAKSVSDFLEHFELEYVEERIRDFILDMKEVIPYANDDVDEINEYVLAPFNAFSVSLTIDSVCELKDVSVSINFTEHEQTIVCQFNMFGNYKSTVDYSGIEAEVKKGVQKIDFSNATYSVDGYEDAEIKVNYGLDGRVSSVSVIVDDYKMDYSDRTGIFQAKFYVSNDMNFMLVQDCGDWVLIEAMSEYSYEFDYPNGSASGDRSSFSMAFNTKTHEVVLLANGTRHKYQQDNANSTPSTSCGSIGNMSSVCTACGAKMEMPDLSKEHNIKYTATLKPGATKCYEGVTISGKCQNPGCSYQFSNDVYYHETVEIAKITNLSCGVDFIIEKCACGEEGDYKHGGCFSTGFVGENVDTNRFSCGVTMIRQYTETPIDSCYTKEIGKYTFTYQGIEYGSYTEEYSYSNHDYIYVYTWLTSTHDCESGVKITRACKNCSYSYTSSYRWHNECISTRYNIRDLGGNCDGYLELLSCPCGKESYVNRYNAECDFDERTYWEGNDNYRRVYTCAVTDPQCTFRYVEKRSTVHVSGCKFVYKYEYYVNCDAQGYGGTKLAERTSSETYIHNYSNAGSTEMHYKNLCASCGAGYEEKYQYINGKNRLVYYKSIEVDGSYYETVYSGYSFNGKCTRNYVTTYSNGKTNSGKQNCCQTTWERITIQEKTCTQPGKYTWGYKCNDCGYQQTDSSYQTEMPGHKWSYNSSKDCYVCMTCGLENSNGADGEVILEDCTEQGSSTIKIGYYIKYTDDASMYQYDADMNTIAGRYILSISVVNKNDHDDQVALSFRNFKVSTSGAHYVSFSRALVEAVAESEGYSMDEYDIRLSFVPVGAGANLDYGITLTN